MIKAAGVLVAGSAVSGTGLAELAGEAASEPLPLALLPYLQNPAPDAMSICFLARGASSVKLAWASEGKSTPGEIRAEALAIPGTPWTRWKARVSGLKPGTACRYQVRYIVDGTEHKTPGYRFVTLDPAAGEMKAAVFNDIHDHRETVTAVMARVKPEDFEFSIFNGDMINDPSAADGARKVFELWNFYVGLLEGHSKPILFVRGNHEVRGSFKEQLRFLFDLPDLSADHPPAEQQWQYEFTAGPVHFIAMDTGEDDGPETPEDSYKRPKFWQAFRKRQAGWLAARAAAKSGARWRIFVSHIPLHNPAGWFSLSSRDEWAPLIREMGVSLMLAGHDHAWKFLSQGKSFKIAGKKGMEDKPDFPLMIGGGPSMREGTVILLKADSRSLGADMYFTDGKLLHSFTTRKPLGA